MIIDNIGKIARAVPNFRGKDYLGRKLIKQFFPNKGIESIVDLKGGGRLICHIEDWIPWHVYFHGQYTMEKNYEKFMLDIAGNSNVVFDVGANIGYYAIPFSMKSNGKVYAFEPMNYQHAMLKRNIALNALQNIVPEKKIVSDSIGVKRIYFAGLGNTGASSLEKTTDQYEDVPSITLDEYCKNNRISHIDVVKIDVEGHELSVLNGLHDMLEQKKVSHLFVEIHDGNLKKAGSSAKKLCTYLQDLGYKSYSIKTGEKRFYQIGNDESLVYFSLPENETAQNLRH